MSRLGKDIVEMQKIVNEIPFDTIWVHWETDMYYPILSSNNVEGYDISNEDKIFIRTPDKTLNGCEAYIYGSQSVIEIPSGTYSIGTYSIGTYSGTYSIIVATATPGYISEVRYGGLPLNEYTHSPIPNIGEVEIEWVTNVNNLFPQENSTRGGGYGIYASYSKLDRRDPRIGKYWITNENGDFIYDSDGNVISIE